MIWKRLINISLCNESTGLCSASKTYARLHQTVILYCTFLNMKVLICFLLSATVLKSLLFACMRPSNETLVNWNSIFNFPGTVNKKFLDKTSSYQTAYIWPWNILPKWIFCFRRLNSIAVTITSSQI